MKNLWWVGYSVFSCFLTYICCHYIFKERATWHEYWILWSRVSSSGNILWKELFFALKVLWSVWVTQILIQTNGNISHALALAVENFDDSAVVKIFDSLPIVVGFISENLFYIRLINLWFSILWFGMGLKSVKKRLQW